MSTVRATLAVAAAVAAMFWGAVAGAAAKPNPHAALDCGFCHEETPRFGVDTRETVSFWRAEGDEPQLCERCHGPEANFHPLGVTPDPERLGTRMPANLPLGKSEAVRDQVVCTSCHFLHAANADRALLRGFPGSDDPGLFQTWQDLCRECHGDGLEKRSPHAGDERACAFCHQSTPTAGGGATLTAAAGKLCEFCHGLKDDAHFAGVNPFEKPQPCTGCHDPHLGKDHPARLKAGYLDPIRDAVTLDPHRKRIFCFACHAGGGSGPLRGAGAVAVCQRCHDSGEIPGMSHPMSRVPPGYTVPQGWPLTEGALSCLTCHFPGHPPGTAGLRADEPRDTLYLLRGGETGLRTAICLECHSGDQWAGRNPHREVAENKTGCEQCHAKKPVWGKDRADTVSFVADINIVCLACHDGVPHPAGVRHTVRLTPAMPPVPDLLPLGTGSRVTCATCHNPHINPPAGHRLRGAKEPSAFCIRCHKL